MEYNNIIVQAIITILIMIVIININTHKQNLYNHQAIITQVITNHKSNNVLVGDNYHQETYKMYN